MSATTNPYEPDKRLVDDPQELARLYHGQGLTVKEIANNHAELGRTSVYESLVDWGILIPDHSHTDSEDGSNSTDNSCRGRDPPPDQSNTDRMKWSQLTE